MKNPARLIALPAVLLAFAASSLAQGQGKVAQESRRPALSAKPSPSSAPAPSGDYYSILNGTPVLFSVHHDTTVETGKPIDVYVFVIELQVMNSDGDLEPEGLQLFNYFTAQPLDPTNDVYPHGARDCKRWNTLVTESIKARKPGSNTWPYIELTTAAGARVVNTNEDGPVFWSDDVQCWGSRDRFPPF